MIVKEGELPGIGKKYSLVTENGDTIVVVIHHTGKREIYYFEDDSEEPEAVIELTDEEARTLGTILVGALFQPTSDEEKIGFLMKHLAFEWIKIPENSFLCGKSIKELEIRKKFGVIIVAIIRDGNVIVSPSPLFQLQPGDTIVVVGSLENIKNFLKAVEEKKS
ncbi:potassium/proton antiporter regulatory subunit, CPA2 family [Desulfurobacterium pacificum]|jgi:TrkA domain protein|uniref:Potassium/proton antiporter regulatory subunit, CPA2 family n=1 Tax=Desulfurobacterium pacificum TaxID=240166 RepID=A0ABY1NVV8_9BACT|nr:cation:proton antiporter regulatory subunit [Desulfurobacterium pacificum]SMP18714.1 potassium/proton antiporter regulatory subunit, CPA2 family [Desulfurobacterium pacificum]